MPAIDSIPLLLAADRWQVVFAIIVFVLYSIGQWVSAREQAKKQPAQPRQARRPQVPQGGPLKGQGLERQRPVGEAPGAGQGNQEEALRREVEDFLRRAQGKPPRQEQPARLQPKPQPKKQPSRLVAEQAESRKPALSSESSQLTSNLRREGVAEHVTSHLSSQQMIDHAERLGDQVGQADERLESRLHKKFDHQMGSLKQQSKSTAPETKELTAAEEVVQLLHKPGGMRQLIIAQEILRRPEF